nr:hypothetical protein [Tanacetum cinerariifolium]
MDFPKLESIKGYGDGKDADVQVNADIQGRTAESQAEIYKIDLDHANKVLSMQEDETDPVEVQEVVDVVTTAKLITEVVTATSTTITAAEVPVPAATTAAASTLTVAPRRRTKGVVIRDPEEEDLEALWSLVKERFATTNPKNFSDDFLLITLGTMFEKPDIHAQIWKNQRSVHGPAKAKGWKLYVMLNALRLEVEEESEVSLELLRFIRQQHQEGAQIE